MDARLWRCLAPHWVLWCECDLLVTSALFFFLSRKTRAERSPNVSRPKGHSACAPQTRIPLRQGGTQGPLQRTSRGKGSGFGLRFVFSLNGHRLALTSDMETHRRNTPASAEGHKPGIQCAPAAHFPSFIPQDGVEGSALITFSV